MEVLPIQATPNQPWRDRKWYEIWWDVWRHPGGKSFELLLIEKDHSRKRALAWLFITSIIVSGYIVLFLLPRMLNADTQGNPIWMIPSTQVISKACTIILYPVVALAGLMIFAGIFHLVAKVFSGYGNWEDLVFCISAIVSPYSILGTAVNSLDILFFQRSGLRLVSLVISVLIVLYALILLVNAVKTAESLTTGGAVATLLVPGVIISSIGLCCSGQLFTNLFGSS